MAGYTQEEINKWGTMGDPLMYSNGAFLRPRADIKAPVPETISDIPVLRPKATIEKEHKWYDTPNMINAGVTFFLSGIASLGQTLSMNGVYKYYEKQEELYIQNAEEQARRLKIRGDILLANLEAEHAATEGKNELSVAASGAGSITGSNLDKLMANRKYNTREEYTQSLDTLWAIENAKRQGYVQALDVAGRAAQAAYNSRSNAILGLVKGLQNASSSLLADKRQEDTNKANWKQTQRYIDFKMKELDAKYGQMQATEEITPDTYKINEMDEGTIELSEGTNGGSVLSGLHTSSDIQDKISEYIYAPGLLNF